MPTPDCFGDFTSDTSRYILTHAHELRIVVDKHALHERLARAI